MKLLLNSISNTMLAGCLKSEGPDFEALKKNIQLKNLQMHDDTACCHSQAYMGAQHGTTSCRAQTLMDIVLNSLSLIMTQRINAVSNHACLHQKLEITEITSMGRLTDTTCFWLQYIACFKDDTAAIAWESTAHNISRYSNATEVWK